MSTRKHLEQAKAHYEKKKSTVNCIENARQCDIEIARINTALEAEKIKVADLPTHREAERTYLSEQEIARLDERRELERLRAELRATEIARVAVKELRDAQKEDLLAEIANLKASHLTVAEVLKRDECKAGDKVTDGVRTWRVATMSGGLVLTGSGPISGYYYANEFDYLVIPNLCRVVPKKTVKRYPALIASDDSPFVSSGVYASIEKAQEAWSPHYQVIRLVTEVPEVIVEEEVDDE